MSIDAALIRRLLAEREGTHLDFKLIYYDFEKNGRYELAKDLMAMANALGPGSPHAYILVGVAEDPSDHTGRLVGVAGPHPDDADLHRRVAPLLSETPGFVFSAVAVDGCDVGVFEIVAGGRPFYPVRDAGNALQRFRALYRDGSNTEAASPTRILQWADEDNVLARDALAAQAEAHRASIAVRAFLSPGGRGGGSGGVLDLECIVTNHGLAPFTVVDTRATWHVRQAFIQDLVRAGDLGAAPREVPEGVAEVIVSVLDPLVLSGGLQKLTVRVPWPQVADAVARLGCPGRATPKAVEATAWVTCEGPSERRVTREIVLGWPY